MSPTIQSGRNYKVSGNYMFVLLQDSKLLKNFFYCSQLYKLWPLALYFIVSRAIIADFSYFLILHFLCRIFEELLQVNILSDIFIAFPMNIIMDLTCMVYRLT